MKQSFNHTINSNMQTHCDSVVPQCNLPPKKRLRFIECDAVVPHTPPWKRRPKALATQLSTWRNVYTRAQWKRHVELMVSLAKDREIELGSLTVKEFQAVAVLRDSN